jgi:hypothetical protein
LRRYTMVAKSEERAAQHKARLDGVIAQLDSEKEENRRVEAGAHTPPLLSSS